MLKSMSRTNTCDPVVPPVIRLPALDRNATLTELAPFDQIEDESLAALPGVIPSEPTDTRVVMPVCRSCRKT